jgi:F-type H+-transporting ATPase subunit delta
VYGLVLGYADGVLEDLGPDLSRVADELAGFVGLLAGSPDLRGALSTSTVQPAKRRAIVRELLSGKVSARTLDLLSFAVQSGPAADYPEDVAGIASLAEARRLGMVSLQELPLGRTAARERLDGYATAVLAGLDRRRLGDVEDELFRFMRTVEGNDALRVAMTTSEVPATVREHVAIELLASRATQATARLAAYAARVGRPRDYLVLLDGLVQRVAREADRRVADVRSATELAKEERERLAAALSRYTGYPVEVRVSVQPELLGGFVATVGDTVVDASLRFRLERAAQALLAPPEAGGTRGEEAGGTGSSGGTHS